MRFWKIQKHVSNVLKQSKRNQTLQLNEPDLKVSSVCNKAYQMYEKCTFQAVPDTGTADRATLKASTLHHFVQDLEYYHTSTLSLEEQVELSVKMLHDPSLQEKFKDLQSKVTYNEEDMAGYKNFVQSEIERQFPLAVGKGSSSSSRRRYKKESDMGQEFPISDELKTLLNKLDNWLKRVCIWRNMDTPSKKMFERWNNDGVWCTTPFFIYVPNLVPCVKRETMNAPYN